MRECETSSLLIHSLSFSQFSPSSPVSFQSKDFNPMTSRSHVYVKIQREREREREQQRTEREREKFEERN